jgi:solute carrier family 35 protein E1
VFHINQAAGGKDGFPMTVSTLQLGVGCVYAGLMWLLPFMKKKPETTKADLKAMLPVAFSNMGAHSASVFALSAGAVSFGQIVKSSEPAFAAVMSVLFYGKTVSKGKWLCLIPVIGGVILASVKELDFAWAALISACIANVFAAIKGNENKKLMDTPGIKDRIGGVSNQFAITTILSFLMSLPIMFAKEGPKMGEFIELLKTNAAVRNNKTNAVTQSVANTAKRVIVIIGVALVMGESLDPVKLLGCGIGIFGVFLYSLVDSVFPPKA